MRIINIVHRKGLIMQELITSAARCEVIESQSIQINMLDDFIAFIDASPKTV